MKKISTLSFVSAFALCVFACSPETKQVVEDKAPAEKNTAVTTSNNEVTAAKTSATTGDGPVMSFTETEYDFGKIKEGTVVKHTFKFTNTGKTPLIIQNATAPCGCTTPSWTKEPIAPNATGEVTVQFDSKGKMGQQNKVVSIVANTQPDITTVTMKGDVEPGVSSLNGPVKDH